MSIINFIDLEPIKATVFFMIVISTLILSIMSGKEDVEFPRWGRITLLLAIFIPFIAALVQENKAIDNINSFTDGRNLLCRVDNFQYRVSKEDGWRVDNIYFFKESLLLRADNCKEL